MTALITGGSSGIGKEMAIYLSELGYDLILVARSKDKLEAIQAELPTKVTIIVADLSNEQKVKELYAFAKKENIDVLINNAGLGDFGYLTDTDINKDLELINTNIKALHILTKYLVREMENKETDTYILNVASAAAFQPGPLMSTYYATKSYVFCCSAVNVKSPENAVYELAVDNLYLYVEKPLLTVPKLSAPPLGVNITL